METTTFAEATATQQTSSHSYTAYFPQDWCIGSVPHGGYVTGTFLRVAQTHFNTTLCAQNQPHCIALHLDFLRRTQAGPALFKVIDTKLGRQASVLNVSLVQEGREEVVGYITHSNMATEAGVTFSINYQLHPPARPVDLALLKRGTDKYWARQPDMPFAEFRKATAKAEFYFPREGQSTMGVADEWIRFASGEKWTSLSLGYVCDMWPMPIEAFLRGAGSNPYDVKKKGGEEKPAARFWYPTVLLNLDIKKALPEEGVEWLFVRVATKQIKNGRMDLEVIIMDEEGDIVALSQHVALAVDSSRNVAVRTANAKM